MKPKLKDVGRMAQQAASAWSEDRAPSMGAALSYYTVFSIAPLLLIVIAVAGLVFGMDAARGAIVGQLQGMLGENAAETIQSALQSVSEPKQGIVATVIGVLLLLVGATTVFAELQDDLDRIWKSPARAKPHGAWGWIRARILSFGMVLGIGFLMLVSLVASAAISALGDWWSPLFGGWEVLAQIVNMVLSFALITVMFALIYRFMPSVRVQWHDVWIGAAVTSLLFTVGKFAIGLYIGKSSVTSGFGAAGSLAVLLLWVYYSAQIFLLGAEFTRVYAQTYGSHMSQAATEAAGIEARDAAAPYPKPATVAALAQARRVTQAGGDEALARQAGQRAAGAAQGGAETAAVSNRTQPIGGMAKIETGLQRHLLPAVGVAAALGALSAWAWQRTRQSRRPASARIARGAGAASSSSPGRSATARPAARAASTSTASAMGAASTVLKGVAKGAAGAVMHAMGSAATRGFKRGMPSSS